LPQYKTSQTDRQTTQCTKGATDSTVGQKLLTYPTCMGQWFTVIFQPTHQIWWSFKVND